MRFTNVLKIFSLIVIFFAISLSCVMFLLTLSKVAFGAYPGEASSYIRSPSSFLVQNPTNFAVILDNYPTPECDSYDYWNIKVDNLDTEFLPNIASTTLTLEKELDLPLDDYTVVQLRCYETSTSTTGTVLVGELEYDDGNAIFRVVESYFLNVSSEFPTSTLAMASDLFTDLNPIVILAVGLPLAFWVIKRVIGLVIIRIQFPDL